MLDWTGNVYLVLRTLHIRKAVRNKSDAPNKQGQQEAGASFAVGWAAGGRQGTGGGSVQRRAGWHSEQYAPWHSQQRTQGSASFFRISTELVRWCGMYPAVLLYVIVKYATDVCSCLTPEKLLPTSLLFLFFQAHVTNPFLTSQTCHFSCRSPHHSGASHQPWPLAIFPPY